MAQTKDIFVDIPQVDLAPGMIHLGIGQPSPSLLPADLLEKAAAGCLSKGRRDFLAYGNTQGNPDFLETLARFLSGHSSARVAPEELFVTNGNSQALDLVCTLFAKPGDTVLVEDPSYFLALDIFRDRGLNLISIPVDGQGLVTEALAQKLAEIRPAFLYTIPVFHNPASVTLSEARRKELVRIAGEHDLLVVADEVYQFLDYTMAPPPSLGFLQDRIRVLSLGSFSKILAPGLRLGWIHTSGELVKRMADSGLLVSGGGLNPFTSEIVRTVMETGALAGHIRHLKTVYTDRIDFFCPLLAKILPDSARFERPAGGYFIWVRFPDGTDTTRFKRAAKENLVGFHPGHYFSPDGKLKQYMRLSFSLYGKDALAEGARRLGRVLGEDGD